MIPCFCSMAAALTAACRKLSATGRELMHLNCERLGRLFPETADAGLHDAGLLEDLLEGINLTLQVPSHAVVREVLGRELSPAVSADLDADVKLLRKTWRMRRVVHFARRFLKLKSRVGDSTADEEELAMAQRLLELEQMQQHFTELDEATGTAVEAEAAADLPEHAEEAPGDLTGDTGKVEACEDHEEQVEACVDHEEQVEACEEKDKACEDLPAETAEDLPAKGAEEDPAKDEEKGAEEDPADEDEEKAEDKEEKTEACKDLLQDEEKAEGENLPHDEACEDLTPPKEAGEEKDKAGAADNGATVDPAAEAARAAYQLLNDYLLARVDQLACHPEEVGEAMGQLSWWLNEISFAGAQPPAAAALQPLADGAAEGAGGPCPLDDRPEPTYITSKAMASEEYHGFMKTARGSTTVLALPRACQYPAARALWHHASGGTTQALHCLNECYEKAKVDPIENLGGLSVRARLIELGARLAETAPAEEVRPGCPRCRYNPKGCPPSCLEKAAKRKQRAAAKAKAKAQAAGTAPEGEA